MSLYITALASGSNGNCYYIGNKNEAVLVDAGISCKEIEKRMSGLGLTMSRVKAVFISHEHTDHIRGLTLLSKKWKLPVYITTSTLRNGRIWLDKGLIKIFDGQNPVSIGELMIQPFSKHHDAADPYSFTISFNGINVGVYTDIGRPCQQLIHHFSRCHAAFLESNYDEHMLEVGGYPYYLKTRIRGDKGHLSNTQALDLFTTHRPVYMSHLLLSHLSQNNNCPKLVNNLFQQHATNTKIVIASRYEATSVYTIQPLVEELENTGFRNRSAAPLQLELSF
jgi:phosphoribosyl 1,2-cyclic phosphodiesterase